MQVEVNRIVLKVGGKEIPLRVEEARELKRLLIDLLGHDPNTVYVPYPTYPSYPVWLPQHWYYSTSGDNITLTTGGAT